MYFVKQNNQPAAKYYYIKIRLFSFKAKTLFFVLFLGIKRCLNDKRNTEQSLSGLFYNLITLQSKLKYQSEAYLPKYCRLQMVGTLQTSQQTKGQWRGQAQTNVLCKWQELVQPSLL